MPQSPHRSIPGLDPSDASKVAELLQQRLVSTLDLSLVLKHVHWNVVGPNFISVHEMLDDEVKVVRKTVDAIAERVRTLGGTPRGTPQAIVEQRTWPDYPLDRADAMRHLEELDRVYDGVITDHRAAVMEIGDTDPVTQDMLIGQSAKLELFQWFVRSFVERATETGNGSSAPEERAAAGGKAGDVNLDAVGERRDMAGSGTATRREGRA